MNYFQCFVVIAVSLLVSEVVSQCDDEAQVCFADVTDADCPIPGQIMVPYSGIFGCCPGCIEPSDSPMMVTPSPHGPFGSFWADGAAAAACQTEDSGCKAPASCLPDGRYAPVQCKGDLFVGRCFCSDENGKRIFGQTWRNEAADMACACSRRRSEIEAAGRLSTLHCTPSGDYERLQCDEGLCWCADPKTGQPEVSPVNEADMKILPCYSATTVGEQYLRRCESIVHAMSGISKEQSDHGTSFHGNPTTFCDYDGSYGPYQIVNGIAYCTGLDGKILGSWQVMSSQMAGMNCNCARDSSMYFPDKGMVVTETCTANGNYQPNQNVGDAYYCVDSDGYPVTDMLTQWPADNCGTS